MFDRFDRGLRLLRESWAVLMEDRRLLVFPICSGICSILAAAAFLIPLIVVGGLYSYHHDATRTSFHAGPSSALHYAGIFAWYLVTYFIVVFFNVGLVACAGVRLRGGVATPGDGFRVAFNNTGRIFMWAVLAATVGTILRAIEERASWIGQIVAAIAGIAWTLATTFVVPVLVFEQVGPIDALKRSAAIFRRTWGESVIGNTGLSLVFGLLSLVGIVFIALGAFAAPIGLLVGLLAALLYWVCLGIVHAALQGIFQTAVYEYAANGAVLPAFSPDLITQAYVPKTR